MGVAGLTSYVNNNLRGAVAMEDLREVSSAWVVEGVESVRTALRAVCKILSIWRSARFALHLVA